MAWTESISAIAANWVVVLSALGVFGVGVVGTCFLVWHHVRFMFRAAHAVRKRYGDDAEAVVEWWFRRGETIEIQGVRQGLVEARLGVSIFLCDSQGRCNYANSELSELFGLDNAYLHGFGWLEAIVPEDRQRIHQSWMYCVQNSVPYENRYVVVNQRTNTKIDCVAKAFPIYKPDHSLLCYLGTVTPSDQV